MKTNIKLYIADKKVDTSDNIALNFNYQLENFENPTIIKNSFTKSIKLEGTDNNNKIFGSIYKFDRKQMYKEGNYVGINFNPSIRTPFKLFNGSELIESGYIQLTDVTIKNKKIEYSITLYGGIGDFFYNLSYNKDGEQLTLADLTYGVTQYGEVLPPDNEFDFRINKELVNNLLNVSTLDGNSLGNFIAFVPSYNGVYENFNNDSILINTNQSKVFTETAITDNNQTYTTYNGYAIGKLSKAYTEWDMREIRSYMQRPALRLSKLIQTICNPINNGGYKVELDEDFFNISNPYYWNTFIALPLFNTQNDGIGDEDEREVKIKAVNNQLIIGKQETGGTIITSANTSVIKDESGNTSVVIDLSDMPYASTLTISLPIQMRYNCIAKPKEFPNENELYLATYYVWTTPPYGERSARFITNRFKITVTDVATDTVLNDNIYLGYGGICKDGDADPNAQNFGKYISDDGGNTFIYYDDYNNNTFVLSLNNVPYAKRIRIDLKFDELFTDGYIKTGQLYSSTNTPRESFEIKNYLSDGYHTVDIINADGKLAVKWQSGGILSNFQITKQKLLKTERSPADYLIDYCKQFGLHFIKDIHSKTINIVTRNNYFKNKVININDKIDRSKDIKITPLLFNKKFYKMALEIPDSYYQKKYYNEYQLEYGQKRINTNYSFNSDVNDIYKDNLYQNTVSVTDKSPYYRTFYNKEGVQIPAFLLDDIDYTLFYKPNTDEESTTEKKYYGSNIVDLQKSVNWNSRSGFDTYPKLCCYTLDGGDKTLSDLQASLIFFNGLKNLKDNEGNPIVYNITDDVTEMTLLNDKPCALYTEVEESADGEKIAIQRTTLPIFSKYIIDNGKIVHSLDFGKPKQMYIYDTEYNEDTTLYNRFWNAFYTDQFDTNTRKITAYVYLGDFKKVNSDMLRQFYAFDNSIWILNKISNYNPNSYGCTQCEFIKVMDINNYTNGQQVFK